MTSSSGGRVTRRAVVATAGAGAATASSAARGRAAARRDADVVVVGAGVFGAWTAERLRAAGKRVLLLDAWDPAHARASSGGESRLIRTAYGADDVYTRMAWESLAEWKRLSAAELPLLHPAGILFFFAREEPYARQSIEAHKALGISLEVLDRKALERRYPQADWAGVEFGLFEPGRGALMARRGVETLVARFVRAGGTYRQAAVAPPAGPGARLESLALAGGGRVSAARFVFACGPWLPKLFPDVLGERIFPTRQEVFFFAPPAGDVRFGPAALPGWADFNDGDIFYGFPDLEGRGCKAAHDAHGPPIDPDAGDREVSAAALAEVRGYMARRFPALARAQLVESRVCQYENSANGDFLIDRHPRWANVLLVGAGSGHGFKHGPAVGRRAAAMALDETTKPEPRFSLASKGRTQKREVH